MRYQHQQLAEGRWRRLSCVEQLANVGSEVERAIRWRQKAQKRYSDQAFARCLELLSLTIDDPQNKSRLKEIVRLYEVLVDYFAGDNLYKSSDKLWQRYFYNFNYLAAVRKQKNLQIGA